MQSKFLAELAESNVEFRRKRFSGEIEASVGKSKRYTLTEIRRNSIDINACGGREHPTLVDVTDKSVGHYLRIMSVHMVGRNGKSAILNPGDYLTPGGGYYKGCTGYEEDLCTNTNLYEVLSECKGYYEWNSSHVNNGLYTNVCLYTPNIVICDNSSRGIGVVDVITCSAPDYDSVSSKRANKGIRDRIELIFNAAVRNGVENLILCGFGCNYAKSDVEFIANTFYEMYVLYSARFNTVTFVMNGCAAVDVFKKVFGIVV